MSSYTVSKGLEINSIHWKTFIKLHLLHQLNVDQSIIDIFQGKLSKLKEDHIRETPEALAQCLIDTCNECNSIEVRQIITNFLNSVCFKQLNEIFKERDLKEYNAVRNQLSDVIHALRYAEHMLDSYDMMDKVKRMFKGTHEIVNLVDRIQKIEMHDKVRRGEYFNALNKWYRM